MTNEAKPNKPFSYGRTRNEKGQFVTSMINMHEGVSAEIVNVEPKDSDELVTKALFRSPSVLGRPTLGLKQRLSTKPIKPLVPRPTTTTVPQTRMQQPRQPRIKQTGIAKAYEDKVGAAAGGAGAYGAYMGAGHAATRYANKRARTMTRSQSRRFQKYRSKMGLPYDRKEFANAPKAAKDAFFRNYPTDLPGGKLRRVLAHTHGAAKYGRAKVALPTAAAGVAGGYAASRNKVNKSMQLFSQRQAAAQRAVRTRRERRLIRQQGAVISKSRRSSTTSGAGVGAGYGALASVASRGRLKMAHGAGAGAALGAGVGAASYREASHSKGGRQYETRSTISPIRVAEVGNKSFPVPVPAIVHSTNAYTKSGKHIGYADSQRGVKGVKVINVYTDKKHRRKGVGTEMMRSVGQTAKGKPVTASVKRSEMGERFAGKHGYKASTKPDKKITANLDEVWEFRRKDKVTKSMPDQSELHVIGGDRGAPRRRVLRPVYPQAIRKM